MEGLSNRTPHAIVVDGHELTPDAPPIRIRRREPLMDPGLYPEDVPVVVDQGIDGNSVVEAENAIIQAGQALSDPSCVIISRVVLDAIQRPLALHYAVCPDTGPDSAIHDESGRIVGVRRLIRRLV